MSNDVAFFAEFSDGAPARSALELAAGAAELAEQSGGEAIALAYGPGAGDAGSLGAAGASRGIVLGDGPGPAIGHAMAAAAAVRELTPLAVLSPATPNGRDLAAALIGLLGVPAFGPVRAARIEDGHLRTEQATLQGSVVTVSEPADGAPQPAIVLVLPSTFTPIEDGSGTAVTSSAPAGDAGAFGKASIVESHPAEAVQTNLLGTWTLAQVAVLVRFVFQILRVEFAGRTLLRPMRSAPRSSRIK